MSEHGTWRDIPRDRIPWYPAVDLKKCKGCKACFNFCRQHVYEYSEETKKVTVARPFNCVVGCSTCAGLCVEEAISFPPLTILKDLRSKQ